MKVRNPLRGARRTLMLAAALTAALLHLSVEPLPAQARGDERAQRVDALFARLAGTPGLAVAIVREGNLLHSAGYGMASMEHGVPITPTTVFDVASLSKQFTGMAVALLAAEGKIGLDDDVRRYIPELPDFGRPLTVRHLVHHTSGLRDWPGTLAIAGWRMDDVISFDQILRMAFTQQELNFEPGSEYTYSNTGYNLLAELLARVTGSTFPEWVRTRLFTPLGMSRSLFRDDHAELVPARAFGYAAASGGGHRWTPNNLTAIGSSSMFSTVEDLARWLVELDRPFLSGGTAGELFRTRGVLNDGTVIPYAFGLSHGEYRGAARLSHSGSWASFRSYLVHFPEQRLGVVVLANGSQVDAIRAAYQVVDVYLEDELAPLATPAGRNGAAARVPPALMDAYAGTYRLGPGWYVEIRREGAGLVAQATREQPAPMTPVSETEFWVEAYSASITFARDPSGRATHFLYRGMHAPRVDDVGPGRAGDLAELVGDYESPELRTSYRAELVEDQLVLIHSRHGRITLTPAWGSDFVGSEWFIGSAEFRRDDQGRVVEMVVNAGPRNRDLRFIRRTQPPGSETATPGGHTSSRR